MNTTEVILVAITDCWGDIDCERTKSFTQSEHADAYATKQIRELSEINNEEISDEDIECCLDDGCWTCDTESNIKVHITEITHYFAD